MPATDAATPRGRARRRAAAGGTLLVVAAAAVTIAVTSGPGHEKNGSPRAGAFAATVQRRNLIISKNATGKISYAHSSTVANRLQGTLTWVPAVGRVIAPGRRLFAVDNFPVILMRGTTPAYRTLDPSVSPGPDVRQLNANLIDLGFDPGGIVENDEWQPATTAGVEAFQAANGEPETGSLTLGTVVFLNGAQRVASLESGAKPVSAGTVEGHAQLVDYTPTPTATPTPTPTASPTSRTDAAISRLAARLRRLQRENRRLQHAVAAAKSRAKRPSPSGPVSGGDTPVMTTTSTNLVVTVDLSPGEQDVTRVGARVPIVMPSGSTVHGHVARIGQATSSGGHPAVPITIHLDKHENGRNLDQAAVSVRFVEKTARHALSVPVTALLARPGGRYAVQTFAAPHRLIDVTLATFATGYVQVSGKGLHPGLKITNAQG